MKLHPKPSEAVFSTVFFRFDFRPEVDNAVLSAVAVDIVGVDVPVKLGDSRSNGFGDIWIIGELFSCRTNEQGHAYPKSAKRLWGVSPKTSFKSHEWLWVSEQTKYVTFKFQKLKVLYLKYALKAGINGF